jgi:hypothetical protein
MMSVVMTSVTVLLRDFWKLSLNKMNNLSGAVLENKKVYNKFNQKLTLQNFLQT